MVWMRALVAVCLLVGGAPVLEAAQAVPQATVSIRQIDMPLVDGADIRFAHLSTADGLSQTKVAQIVQDDRGFLWFGTQFGLNRYDGYNFKVFVHEPGVATSLSGVFIRSLFKDREGSLWAGCDQSLNRFDAVTETFVHYPIPFVSQISQDSAGTMWLATGTGLYELDPKTGRTRHYDHNPNDPSSLSGSDISVAREDRNGKFWVGSTAGIDQFDRQTGKVTLHIPVSRTSWGVSFYEDRFGAFWIINASGNCLSLFDRNTNTLTWFSVHGRQPAFPSAPAYAIRAVLEDREGTLWFATNNAGLLKFDREHGRFIRYTNNPSDADSLPQNNVISLFADVEGNIWAGLGRMGLARFSVKPLPFKRLPHNPQDPNIASEPFAGALYEDSDGIVWLGTSQTLNRIDRITGQYTTYRTSGPGVGSDVIAIREDRLGNLWLGTYGHGLHRFDRRTGKLRTFRHDASDSHSLSSDFVSRMLVDRNGVLWVAARDALDRYDPATDSFTAVESDPEKNVFYQELVEDREGTIWLGTDSAGLRRFDPKTGKLTVYLPDMNRTGTLSDNRINSIHFDASGAMWLGTQNGMDRFDLKTGTATAYTIRDGLPGNAIGCILEDTRGDLWMSTNNGVAKFHPPTRKFTSYSTSDGLPGPDLTGWGACFQSRDGEMFFGGFSGATAFFPAKVSGSSYIPPIALTDFRLYGNRVEIGGSSPLRESITFSRGLSLSRNQNVFSLTFSALSYSNPETNRCRYRLEPLERDWNETRGDRRQATYSTLPAGRYTFRAEGAIVGGAWSEPGVSLIIEIRPAWWATWWFRSSCAAAAFLLLLFAYRYRIDEIDRQFNLRLDERTRLAQEFHDTILQTIHASAMVVNVARQSPQDTVTVASALDKLSVFLSQATDEVRSSLQSLRSSTEQTNDLANALRQVGDQCAQECSLRFLLSIEGAARNMHPVARDEIFQIGREAIRNACRHSQGSQVEVTIRYARRLTLRIYDDGRGIEPEALASGKGGHFGLKGMRERAQRIGGELKFASSPGAGTEVTLTCPGYRVYRGYSLLTRLLRNASRPVRKED